MNDNRLSDDDALQLVFGESDDSRRSAVRKNVAEDAELAAAVRALTAAVAAVRAECVGQVSDDFNDRLRRRMPDVLDGTQAQSPRATFLTRCFSNGRWIMRHPVTRATAAAIFLLAIAGVALWLHAGGTTPAFADFIQPILDAKNAKFKITTEMKGLPGETKALPAEMKGLPAVTGEVMVLDATRSRQEMEMPNKSKMVMIFDWGRGKSLTLEPAEKRATVLNFANMPKDNVPKDPFAWFRSLLLDARDKPDAKRERLGETNIDGRRAVGFRVSLGSAMVMSLWGDPKTGLPVRIETSMPMFPNMKSTMSDFVFNVNMDDSLFSVEPPAGYEIIKAPTIDISPAQEKDLLETFRRHSELAGGAFPDSLDMQAIFSIVYKAGAKFGLSNKGQKQSAKQTQEMMEVMAKLQRGLMFTVQLSSESDAHYAGKGVSLGAADTPIFWYRPKDAKKYRVIYADLSVREADTAPSVPNAQALPAPSAQKK